MGDENELCIVIKYKLCTICIQCNCNKRKEMETDCTRDDVYFIEMTEWWMIFEMHIKYDL